MIRTQLGLPPMPSYRIANVAAVVLAFVVVSWYGYHVAMSYIPPSDYEDVYIEQPVIQKGSSLFITYAIHRKRFCPTFLHRFILTDTEPHSPVWSEIRLGGGSTPIGRGHSTHEITAAKLLEPGDYIFRGAANPKCPEGEHFFFHKDVKFKVVP